MKAVKYLLPVTILLLLIAGCAEALPTPVPVATTAAIVPTFSGEALPATFTVAPTIIPVSPSPPPTPTPPGPTATPIDFTQTAVELRYLIPELGLERRLQGNISGQIIFVDEVTGKALQRSNQSGILLELQGVLPDMILDTVPEGCTTCVYVEYELPLDDVAGEGWLRDPILLASIENLMAVVLGPHFPPDAVVGLRRSASPYAPAHSIAVREDGSALVWLATEGEIGEVITAAVSLPPLLAPIDGVNLKAEYAASCPGVPVEQLLVNLDGTATSIDIFCPEFTLPTTLQPLYLALDALLASKLATLAGPVRPPSGFPLAGVVDYRRSDGARLTIFADGRVQALDAASGVYSTTLPLSQVVSTTTSLVDSGLVGLGLATYFAEGEDSEEADSHLLVRGAAGVYDARWSGTEPAVAALDELLDDLIDVLLDVTPTPEGTEEGEEPEETVGTATAVPATTEDATPTLTSPTPTP